MSAATGASVWIDASNFGLPAGAALRGAGINPAQFGISTTGQRDYFGVTVPPAKDRYSIGASQGN